VVRNEDVRRRPLEEVLRLPNKIGTAEGSRRAVPIQPSCPDQSRTGRRAAKIINRWMCWVL